MKAGPGGEPGHQLTKEDLIFGVATLPAEEEEETKGESEEKTKTSESPAAELV